MPIPLTRAGDQLKYYFTDASGLRARPTGWEVSLHSGNPVLGNEVATMDVSNYERQAVTFTYTEEALGGVEDRAQVANDVLVEWDPAPPGSNPVTISFVAVRDADDGGLLGYGQLNPPIIINDGTVISFNPGDIILRD